MSVKYCDFEAFKFKEPSLKKHKFKEDNAKHVTFNKGNSFLYFQEWIVFYIKLLLNDIRRNLWNYFYLLVFYI